MKKKQLQMITSLVQLLMPQQSFKEHKNSIMVLKKLANHIKFIHLIT